MYRRSLLALALALSARCASGTDLATAPLPEAPSGTYVLEKTHASMLWRINHMGMSTYTARFRRFDAIVVYDALHLDRSSVEATVDVSSLETDYPTDTGHDFNADLTGPSFFNTSVFPKAVFRSQRIDVTGANTLRISGDLTLLGTTQPIVLDATLNGTRADNPNFHHAWLGFSAHGIVRRMDFGLNPMPKLTGVGNEVLIDINAEFLQRQ